MDKVKYMIERLKEAGTWRLFVALAAMAGVSLTETHYELVLTGVSVFFIVWESLKPDAPKSA